MFTEVMLDNAFNSPYAALIVDLDRDGDNDVVAGAGNDDFIVVGRLAWWENDGSGGFAGHEIATSVSVRDLSEEENQSDRRALCASIC